MTPRTRYVLGNILLIIIAILWVIAASGCTKRDLEYMRDVAIPAKIIEQLGKVL